MLYWLTSRISIAQMLLVKVNYHHHHHECSAQGQVLNYNRRNLSCSSAEGRSSTGKLRNQGCSFTRDWIGAVASRCFPHPTLSLESEKTVKDLKRAQGHHVEVRRVDLANWTLRTSPKFTTRVKYQFHRGFLLDQRSGNNNRPSPQLNYINTTYWKTQ